jgi:glucose-1-phosphate thymidylyltransferase
MKGIILAGGSGTRLQPLTHAMSKQLLPVYKYPMIYFPICTLRDMGITDILIITTPQHQDLFKKALQNINSVNLTYMVQEEPKGLAQAFVLAEEWLAGDTVTLVLGDNVIINQNILKTTPNTIFTFKVKHPERYGVVEYKKDGTIMDIVEKPIIHIGNDAVIGLYVFSNSACAIAKNVKPSIRGELEIVDVIKGLKELEGLSVNELDGFWFDAGTPDDLLECANFVRAIEDRTIRTFNVT